MRHQPKTVQYGHKTVGHYDGFSVTEEAYRGVGNGMVTMLISGEIVELAELRKRGKGTWMKVAIEKS